MTQRFRRCPLRRGLTITEVVVVLVLLLIAVGVLLTAIPRMRESASRLQCANNLKQMGEAVHVFRAARGFLPAARIADGYATREVQIAPYLRIGKGNPLDAWELPKSYDHQSEVVRTARVHVYLCPSQGRPSGLRVGRDEGAPGDYACSSGDGSPAHPWQTAEGNGASILGEVLRQQGDLILDWRGRTDLAALTHGESQTIVIGEKHVPWDHVGGKEERVE